jgi:RimJ/RimL family protein N-acetyltransferase
MNLRTDEGRGRSEELGTGLASLRRAGLLLARAHASGHEERVDVKGKTFVLRPIRADDVGPYEKMVNASDASSLDYRFPQLRRPLTRATLARYTKIDYDREMAFVVVSQDGDKPALLGEVRVNVFPGSDAAEFAIFVHSHARGLGLGRALLMKMIGYCTGRGFSEILGQVVPGNERMLALARSVGMRIYRTSGAGIAIAHLKLPASFDAVNSLTSTAGPSTNSATATNANVIGITTPHHRPRTHALRRSNSRSAYTALESYG